MSGSSRAWLCLSAVALAGVGCGAQLPGSYEAGGESGTVAARPGSVIEDGDSASVVALKQAGASVLRLPFPVSWEGSAAPGSAAKKVDLSEVFLDPEVLDALNDVPGITELVLTGPEVNDGTLALLTNCRSLTVLDLSGSNVTDAGLRHLASDAFPSLRILKLNATNVSGAALSRLTKLTALSLAETPVSDKDLLQLKDLTHLEYLNLVGTRVTGGGVAEFKRSHGRRNLLVLGVQEASERFSLTEPKSAVGSSR